MSIWGGTTSTSANTYSQISGSGATLSGSVWYSAASFWESYKVLPQKFNDKHEGMALTDFLAMWTKDGYRIIELDTKELPNEEIAKRYNVYSEEALNEYGNHLGFVVILNRTNKVIRHGIFNVRGN